jgi:hypothetical protein
VDIAIIGKQEKGAGGWGTYESSRTPRMTQPPAPCEKADVKRARVKRRGRCHQAARRRMNQSVKSSTSLTPPGEGGVIVFVFSPLPKGGNIFTWLSIWSSTHAHATLAIVAAGASSCDHASPMRRSSRRSSCGRRGERRAKKRKCGGSFQ